jgi:DNA-binding LacI/PurR family transcriptional regulator
MSKETTTIRRAPTMQDVARLAGVTPMTVSNVFGNKGRVSDETREIVMRTAKEMGYRPNAVAQSLKRRCTNTIGFYFAHQKGRILDFRNEFIGEVLYGAQQACAEHEKHLLLHGSYGSSDMRQIADEITNGRIDGVLVFAPANDPVVQHIAQQKFPAVAVADPVRSLPSVTIDELEAARLVVEHLKSKGHQKVFYFYNWPAHEHSAVTRRKNAFIAQAQKVGIEIEEICHRSEESPWRPEQLVDTIRECRGRFTAGLGWADATAELLWGACDLLGVRVPQDLAIVGFDGCYGKRQPRYDLTTIRAGWDDVANCATQMLIKQIEGEEVPGETVLSVELLQGQST